VPGSPHHGGKEIRRRSLGKKQGIISSRRWITGRGTQGKKRRGGKVLSRTRKPPDTARSHNRLSRKIRKRKKGEAASAEQGKRPIRRKVTRKGFSRGGPGPRTGEEEGGDKRTGKEERENRSRPATKGGKKKSLISSPGPLPLPPLSQSTTKEGKEEARRKTGQ